MERTVVDVLRLHAVNELRRWPPSDRVMTFVNGAYLQRCLNYAWVYTVQAALIVVCKLTKPDRQWQSSSFQESKKVRVSRDLWPWPWPWAHPGDTLTRRPSCVSLVAIGPIVCEKKRFAQKFTDRQTDRRRTPRHFISSFLEWANKQAPEVFFFLAHFIPPLQYLDIWPFDRKIWCIRLCPRMHRWCKFGEHFVPRYGGNCMFRDTYMYACTDRGIRSWNLFP